MDDFEEFMKKYKEEEDEYYADEEDDEDEEENGSGKTFTREEIKQILEECKKEYPPDQLFEFCFVLEMALRVYFRGRITRHENVLTCCIPKGQKFRITVKTVKRRNKKTDGENPDGCRIDP